VSWQRDAGSAPAAQNTAMNTQQNKQLAGELFARFTAGDIAGVLGMMAEDATWKIPGRKGEMPSSGTHSKEKIARVFHAMVAELKGGALKMTMRGALAEGDQVAVEAESYGELKNGRVYSQEYHFLMTFRDGKISAVREYLDTQHAFLTWFKKD
jgi:ketosteroid isomerase-like protein